MKRILLSLIDFFKLVAQHITMHANDLIESKGTGAVYLYMLSSIAAIELLFFVIVVSFWHQSMMNVIFLIFWFVLFLFYFRIFIKRLKYNKWKI